MNIKVVEGEAIDYLLRLRGIRLDWYAIFNNNLQRYEVYLYWTEKKTMIAWFRKGLVVSVERVLKEEGRLGWNRKSLIL